MSKNKTFEDKVATIIHEMNRSLYDLGLETRITIHPISMSSFVVAYSSTNKESKFSHQFIESNDMSMTYAFLWAIASNLYFLDRFIKANKISFNFKEDKIQAMIQSNLQALINQKTYLIK
jgi:hypothetical protein